MRSEILNLLRCPRCRADLQVVPFHVDSREIRTATLTCTGEVEHAYDVEDGIIRLQTGFDHDAVQRELDYENSTYVGSDRLRDPALIAHFPDTLSELWPHICNFGPDFRVLMDQLCLPHGAKVLDVGTGPCWSSRLLAQRGWNVIALDVNDSEFYGLRTSDLLFETHGVYFERILESMTELPFRDGVLDAITFNASFHHTPDMAKTLAECQRVLRPNGVVAMVNEEFASVRQKLLNHKELTDTGSHHSIDYCDFERALTDAGFSVKYRVASHVHEQLERRFSRRVGNLLVKTFERFPMSLKQLNSALILLTKRSATRPLHRELSAVVR